jgi:hypothetical protein
MRRIAFVICAVVALSACGGKEVVENQSAVENLSFESAPANDASALEQVEAENARMQFPESANDVEANEPAASNSATNNATSNATSNSD